MDTSNTPTPRYISADEWKRLHAAPVPQLDPDQLTIDDALEDK